MAMGSSERSVGAAENEGLICGLGSHAYEFRHPISQRDEYVDKVAVSHLGCQDVPIVKWWAML